MDLRKATLSFGRVNCVDGSKITNESETSKTIDDVTLHAEAGSFVNYGGFHGDITCTKIVSRLRAAGCVFAEDEARLLLSAERTPADLAAMVDSRAAGLPLEHVIGWAEFCGLRIAVDPGVFIPRQRTKFLVRQAADIARPGAIVVDLCCGSGAVGAALAAVLERIELHATDIDPAAVLCARRNVTVAGGYVYEGDLYEPLPSTLRGASTFWSPTHPTYPPRRSDCSPRRPAYTRHGWRSTGERTGLTSSDGWRTRPQSGWHRAGACWSRLASDRRRRPSRFSLATGWYRKWPDSTNWTPPSSSEPSPTFRAIRTASTVRK